MDEKLKQLIIDAFNHGIRYNKNKGHWITPLDFIEEKEQQLKLYKVVGQSEQLMQSCSVCGTTKHPIMGAHCKASNCLHEH